MNIMKSFSFCYAHRIWNQQLSNNGVCKCRFIHGHNTKVELFLSRPTTIRGMVIDFNELKCIKEFIDTVLDHKFLIDVNDPLLNDFVSLLDCSLDDFVSYGGLNIYSYLTLNRKVLDRITSVSLKELGASLVVLNREPTSENLASFMKHQVEQMLLQHTGLLVEKVRWWESDSSFAEF